MFSHASLSQPRHIHGIDLLRFVAAMLVLLHHFATYAASRPEVVFDPAERAYGFLSVFENIGATGVEIFFVISGFVISMSALPLAGGAGARSFALARAIRILPALWISAAISLVALLYAGEDALPLLDRFVRSALLSPVGPYIDGVVWSLVVEAVFYLLIGLAIAFVRPLPLVKIALGLGLASSFYLAVLLAVTVRGDEQLVALLTRFPFKVFLLRYGVFFAIGMLLWHATSRKDRPGWASALSVFGLFAITGIVLENWGDISRAVGSVAVWLAAMAFLAAAIRWNDRVAPHPALRLLGDMSYTIYLNHYTTGMVVVYALHQAGVAGPLSFVLALVGVLFVSFVVLRAEKKARNLVRRTLKTQLRHA
ncbi:acyltransferase family protein [Shinella sp. BYT-45]|uniref:acyltransferase family protein n=1 Tax=Shinella sp. BYT-45 TaxID=3377377 RepID=UPI00397F3071